MGPSRAGGGEHDGRRFDELAAGDAPKPITGGSGQIRPLEKTKRGLEFAIELNP